MNRVGERNLSSAAEEQAPSGSRFKWLAAAKRHVLEVPRRMSWVSLGLVLFTISGGLTQLYNLKSRCFQVVGPLKIGELPTYEQSFEIFRVIWSPTEWLLGCLLLAFIYTYFLDKHLVSLLPAPV